MTTRCRMGGHAAPISMMQPIQPRCAHPFVVMARSEEPRQGVVSDFTLCTKGCEKNRQQRTAIALSWSLAEETRKSKTFHCNSLQPWLCLHCLGHVCIGLHLRLRPFRLKISVASAPRLSRLSSRFPEARPKARGALRLRHAGVARSNARSTRC